MIHNLHHLMPHLRQEIFSHKCWCLNNREKYKHLSTQLIFPKYSYNSYSFPLLLFKFFLKPIASTSKTTLVSTASAMIENRGNINKNSASYKAVEILSKPVTTISHLSSKMGFSLTGLTKNHPRVTPKPRSQCQYCI